MHNWQSTLASLWMNCSAGWRRAGEAGLNWKQRSERSAYFLERNNPPPSKHRVKSSQSGKASFTLQEGQRKAVRAALLAGVAPTQVAKHFGLSLATVRKVLEEAS